MKIIQNIAQLASCRAEGGQGEIHPIADAALVWDGDTIAWVRPRSEGPARYRSAQPLDVMGVPSKPSPRNAITPVNRRMAPLGTSHSQKPTPSLVAKMCCSCRLVCSA